MAYTPTVWETGDEITEEKLNKIEKGISQAHSDFVPKSRKVNGKPLSSDIKLVPSDIGALSETPAITADCNTELTAGGHKFLITRYVETTLNSPLSEGLVIDIVGIVLTYAYTGQYGRQICMTGSLGGLCMRHMRNGIITKWVKIATMDDAVNKTGDTMTGNLMINRGESLGQFGVERLAPNGVLGRSYMSVVFDGESPVAQIRLTKDGTQYGAINVGYDNTFRYRNKAGKTYDVVHVGNKPSNYYNGDGSAVEETLCTNALGNMAIICGGSNFCVINENGGICSDGTTLSDQHVKFSNGELIVSTSDARVNKLNTKYFWTVL